MRIRSKPWAKPELEACSFCIDTPEMLSGRWQEEFKNGKPIYLELGCGKGGFISKAASENQDKNFIAVDIKNEMLVLAKRKIEAEYDKKNLSFDNVRIFIKNIEQIDNIFSKEDKIERIYINFCNPWPKSKHKKRRLTHYRQLVKYREFLNGELWFKTDDDALFKESFEYFEQAGYKIKYKTYDLHESGFEENIMTEHEQMFTAEGKKIKFLIAELNEQNNKEGNNMSSSHEELIVDGNTVDEENTFKGIGVAADGDFLNNLMDYKIKYPDSYKDIMDILFKPYYGAGVSGIRTENKVGSVFISDAGKVNSDINTEILTERARVNESKTSLTDITTGIIKNLSCSEKISGYYTIEQLVKADQPWSGYYEVSDGLWSAAHLTHFIGNDWKRIRSFDIGTENEVHTAFMSDSGDYTLVFVNSTDSEILYNVSVTNTDKADSVLYCIESIRDEDNGNCEWFRVVDKIIPASNKKGCFYRIDVKAHSILTCTTVGVEDVDGVNSVKSPQFASAHLELPYTDSLDYSDEFLITRNRIPIYTTGMQGKFEIKRFGDENVLEHIADPDFSESSVLCIGDRYWSNYSAKVEVMIEDGCDSCYAGIGLRCVKNDDNTYTNGCELRLYSDGRWQLRCLDDIAAEGTDGAIDVTGWNNLKISADRDILICSINKQVICNYKMSEPMAVSGYVSLNGSGSCGRFRKLSVNSVAGVPCFCVNNDITVNNLICDDSWKKNKKSIYTEAKNAVFEVTFFGNSAALMGSADDLRLKVEIDDKISAAGFSIEKSLNGQTFYYVSGLSECEHRIKVTVLSGKLSFSGIITDEKKHVSEKKQRRARRTSKTEAPKEGLNKSTLMFGAGLAAAGVGILILKKIFGKKKK